MVAWALNNRESAKVRENVQSENASHSDRTDTTRLVMALKHGILGFYAFPGSDHHDAEVRRERCACCISFDEDPGLLPKS